MILKDNSKNKIMVGSIIEKYDLNDNLIYTLKVTRVNDHSFISNCSILLSREVIFTFSEFDVILENQKFKFIMPYKNHLNEELFEI